jgi:hypothetical protein
MTFVVASGAGATQQNRGVDNQGGTSPNIRNSVISGTSEGIRAHGTPPGVVSVDNSVVTGTSTYTLNCGGGWSGWTIRAGRSRLSGAGSVASSGSACTCAGIYDNTSNDQQFRIGPACE